MLGLTGCVTQPSDSQHTAQIELVDTRQTQRLDNIEQKLTELSELDNLRDDLLLILNYVQQSDEVKQQTEVFRSEPLEIARFGQKVENPVPHLENSDLTEFGILVGQYLTVQRANQVMDNLYRSEKQLIEKFNVHIVDQKITKKFYSIYIGNISASQVAEELCNKFRQNKINCSLYKK